MKRFKAISILLIGGFCFPLLLHAQVIRISEGANMIVTDGAKIVLHDGSASNFGSIKPSTTPLVFTAGPDKAASLVGKTIPAISNITVSNFYGTSLSNEDNVYIFLGRDQTNPKLSATQPFMQAWPNPARDRFTVTLSSDKVATGTIVLQDEKGRILERRRVNYAVGINTIQWDLSKYTAGNYLLVFDNAPGKYVQVVKQ